MSNHENNNTNQTLVIGLAVVGGIGLTIMTIALAIGVIQGANASDTVISTLFFGGLVLLAGASFGWFGVTQPYKNFDDINVPHYTGHHDEH